MVAKVDIYMIVPGEDWPIEAVQAVYGLQEQLANRERQFEHAVKSWKANEDLDRERIKELEEALAFAGEQLASARHELLLFRELMEEE